MTKKDELQAKRNELFKHSEDTLARLKELDKEIADESKPKLRQYNIYSDGHSNIILTMYNGKWHFNYNDGSVFRGSSDDVLSQRLDGLGYKYIGNLDDDLKALQEDVTKIKLKDLYGDGDLEIEYRCNSSQVFFAVDNQMCYIKKEDWPAFEMLVRQFGATLKRNK